MLHGNHSIISLNFGATKTKNFLLSLRQQAWKHLSSKVSEILEELRAVQVRCLSVCFVDVCLHKHARIFVCNWRLGWPHIVKLGCRANKSIGKQLQATCLCAESLQLALLLEVSLKRTRSIKQHASLSHQPSQVAVEIVDNRMLSWLWNVKRLNLSKFRVFQSYSILLHWTCLLMNLV